MSESVNLPALGESVTEGTVTRWLKQVGDRVEVDEPLLEVSTDKVDTEIPSPIAGTIEEILVAEDETAEVGAPLVRIGDGSGTDGDGTADSSASTEDNTADEPGQEQSESPEEPEQEQSESPEEPEQEQSESPEEPEQEQSESPEEPEQEQSESPEEPVSETDNSTSSSGEGSEVTLPALGESVTEGTVTRWLKSVGDDVEVDEPLLEVSTDKVDTEIPSPFAGKLQEIRVNEDETAEVGAVLAVIGSGASASPDAPQEKAPAKEAEPVAAAPSQEREAPVEKPKSTSDSSDQQDSAAKKSTENVKTEEKPTAAAEDQPASGRRAAAQSDAAYVTPLVRRLANESNVDLSTVEGTGVGGRIRKQDVVAAAADASKQESAPEKASSAAHSSAPTVEASTLRGTVEKTPRIRQTIARRMRESLEVSAQLTQVIEVDMTKIAKLRSAAKENFHAQNGAKLTFLPFIATAVTEALKQHPKLNASIDADAKEVTYHDAEHLAIAVDTEKGLLVPVIRDAGDLNLAGIAKKIGDVGARTRNGQIGPDELAGGTFTITNIGSVGALFDTPIINQPQVGILGTGAIVKRPVVVTDADGGDTIAIRSMMYLCLTYDHRIVDGADAGRFLQTLKKRLEDGLFSADLGL
ncbi:2-oxoglutarate dehydrogenase, E2 component, dihydrolipoamide succinyltransferase [Arthrobacter roseus]